ncbi:hypothetical protein MBLNU459_g0018t1 [Dothideomycetes sp. NU459]
MSWPYPVRSKYNPANGYQNIDYSMTSPLLADGSNFPCKGYQNDRPATPVVTYTAGHKYNMTLAGSATHGGGSCQLSLSYDNGATFRVIQSMIGGCPLSSTYNFTIPSYVPSGEAIFAWTWQNMVGNREYYMNCAEVTIQSSASRKRDTSSFNSLPFIWKANIPGVNNCTTTASENPVYPEPGPVVLYSNGMTSSDPESSSPGECDAPTPYGKTYEDLDETSAATSSAAASSTVAAAAASTKSSSKTTTTTSTTTSSKPTSTTTSSKTTTTSSKTTMTSSRTTAKSSSSSSVIPSSSSKSSSKVSLLTSKKVSSSTTKKSSTTTKKSSISTKAASSSASKKITLSAVNAGRVGSVASSSSSSSSCPPDVTLTVYASSTASTFKTSKSAAAASSTVSSAAAAASSSSAATGESYATGDLASYLPCVPGTYICTTNTTWVTCDQTMYSDGSTAWVYEESRSVAAGTMCVPNLSPYSAATAQYAQQADAPSGYYRDDRIGRSQPEGACASAGAVKCTNSGSQFQICDDGGWVDMGSVPSGTICANGAIVASS